LQPTVGFITHVTCRLTAENRDQLRNPTFGLSVGYFYLFLLLKGGERRGEER